MSWRKVLSFCGILVLVVAMLPINVLATTADQAALQKIEPLVLEEIDAAGQTDYFVWMTEKADLSPAYRLPTKLEKGQFVYETLVATAARTQKDLRAYLDGQGVAYQPFYIANKILVRGGSYDLLLNIAARPDVAQITANHKFQLQEPFKNPDQGQTEAVEPNITFVKAPDVWALGFTGQGTVMAGNDTGLDWDHPAIINKYRGWNGSVADHNYNWWDATGTYPNVPDDGHGHGTHTTGTMVGDDGGANQIGMAPGAQTVHCKNMDNGGSGDDGTFTECFQWDLAPWDLSGSNPMPSLAPDAINNSWGYWGGGADQFRDEIQALHAAGILVEVSAGNEGSGCQTLRSPGDYHEVMTTGSVNHATAYPGTLTGFSSRGPSSLDPGYYFPDIMAPGENIRSSVPGGGYQGGWSGTSMSGPHATALVGLMWSACPTFRGRVEDTIQIIQDTAVPLTGQGGSNCGGDYTTGPNNDWGYGTIDSLAAVQAVLGQCGPTGSLHGYIYDDVTTLPIAGAKVTAASYSGYAWNKTTDATGYYTFSIVPEDTYTVTAEHVAYTTAFTTGVQVFSNTVTQVDLRLTPRGTLSGYVTDADNGFPLVGATVTADDGTTTNTNSAGYYTMYLDEGTHDVTASMPDYAPDTQTVVIVSGQGTQQDFALWAAIAFVPSPLHVTVPWDDTYNTEVTLTNRQTWDYDFVFVENPGGYVPGVLGSAPVTIPAGPATAPAGTAVAAGPSYAARPARTYSVDRQPRPQAAPNVLLLNADDDNSSGSPIQAILQAYGDLGAVDLYDARYGTPDLTYLQNYDVVLVWSNYVFADSTAIGNVLADYVDAGGKVIDLQFAIDTSWGMQGRFVTENYTAMVHGSTLYTGACLGTYDPTHPIMAGVTNVCENYYRIGSSTLTPGSTDVAWWSDGQLFVAVKDNRTVVTINDYVGYYYQWTGQLPDVLHNAIFWLYVAPDVLWFGQDPVSDTVPAQSSMNATMYFTASTAVGVMQPGDYWCTLKVDGDPTVAVGVTMTVEPDTDMGRLHGYVIDHCTGAPVEATVDIAGGDPITQTTSDPNGYYSAWLFAGTYPVTFSAPDYLDYSTNVTIVAGAVVTLNVDFFPDRPCMSVEPGAMSATFDWGDSGTYPLTITNDGAVDLNFAFWEVDRGWTPLVRTVSPVPAPLPAVADPGTTNVAGRTASPGGTEVLDGGIPEAWVEAAPVPAGIVRYAMAQCPDDINVTYIIGGVSNGSIVNTVYRYDAVANSWTTLAPLPMADEGPNGVCYDGKIYVSAGGYSSTYFQIYDIASDTWTSGPALPHTNHTTGAMGAWDGKVFVVGGDDNFYPGDGVSDIVDIYDIASNAWIGTGTPMPHGRSNVGYFQTGNLLYVVGGWDTGHPTNAAYTERYDMETDTWEEGPAFTPARADFPIAITSQYIYAIGGDSDGGGYWDSTNSVWRYDWTQWPGGAWEDVADPIPVALQAHFAGFTTDAFTGGEVWSVGGLNGPTFQWYATNQYRESEAPWSPVAPDVPWLFEAPVSGTVAPGESFVADVTMDSAYVNQPGIYWAILRVKSNDTQNRSFPVHITMTVLPATDMGKVAGTVTDNCTGDPVEALVTFVGGVPITQTQADENGYYAAWLVAGSYWVTFTADGYWDYGTSVVVTAGVTTTLNAVLVPDRPCIAIEPDLFEVWLVTGTAVFTHGTGMDIINNGGQELTYELQERPGGYVPPAVEGLAVTPWTSGSTQALAAPLTVAGPARPVAPVAPAPHPEDVLWDQPLSTVNQAAYVDQDFTDFPDYSSYLFDDFVSDVPWVIESIFVPGDGWNGFSTLMNADSLNWAIYADDGTGLPDGYPGGGNPPVWSISLPPSDPQIVLTPGTPGGYISNSQLNLAAPAIIPDGHYWFVFYPVMSFSSGGQYGRQAADTTNGYVGKFINPGGGFGYGTGWNDWTVIGPTQQDQAFRLEGYRGSLDVPWLWEIPVTGTVPAQGTGNAGIYFTALNTDTTPMPLGTYTATLRVKNNDPVAGTPVAAVIMHIVEQHIPPTASFTATTPVCLGQAMAFFDTSDPGVPNVVDYWWDFGDGIGTSTEQNPTYVYAAAGLYTVTLTITQHQTGLTDSYEMAVEVQETAAAFEYSVPACVNVDVAFTNMTTGPGPFTYLWAFGDGITSTLENPSHAYGAAGPYTVTLGATGACGYDEASAVVDVLPEPTAAFTYTAAGLTVTFTNSSLDATTYEWDFGDNTTSTETNPVHTYAAAGTYTVTLTASGICGTDETTMAIEVVQPGYYIYLPLIAWGTTFP